MRNHPTHDIWLKVAVAGLLLASALLSGCDEDTSDPCADRFAQATSDSSIEVPDEYVAGVERVTDNGLFLVTLVRSTPTPKFTGDYTWLVTVEDAACGTPTDVHVKAEPTMPQHGHGTTPEFTEATLNEANEFTLTDMDLFMPGVWQIEISVETGDGTEDTVSWFFDLQG